MKELIVLNSLDDVLLVKSILKENNIDVNYKINDRNQTWILPGVLRSFWPDSRNKNNVTYYVMVDEKDYDKAKYLIHRNTKF